MGQKQESINMGNIKHAISHRVPGVIVNADDFGLSVSTNTAIEKCFTQGLISSATIMVNMPGFEDACRLVHKHGWEDRVGVHLNLTTGQPLLTDLQHCIDLCDSNGNFWGGFIRNSQLNRKTRELIKLELLAQIRLARDHGLPLTHADSHHHIHTLPHIFPIVASTLRKSGIYMLRVSFNLGPIPSVKRLLKFCFNWWIRCSGFVTTKKFSGIKEFLDIPYKHRFRMDSIEIMVHPHLTDSGQLIDAVLQCPLDQFLNIISKEHKIVPYRAVRLKLSDHHAT